jgi:hypothetical protein
MLTCIADRIMRIYSKSKYTRTIAYELELYEDHTCSRHRDTVRKLLTTWYTAGHKRKPAVLDRSIQSMNSSRRLRVYTFVETPNPIAPYTRFTWRER